MYTNACKPGWSNVSFALKDKIEGMRKKAKMVQHLEGSLRTCSEGLQEYGKFVECPLPPSLLLEARQQELRNTAVRRSRNHCFAYNAAIES